MKKNYFKLAATMFAIVATTATASAQGAYVNLNFGYGFSAASGNMSNFTNTTSTQTNTGSVTTEEQISTSLGKGVNFGGAFGYMFNKNIGAELGINYLMGAKTEATWNSTTNFGNSNTVITASANMLRFMPTIVLATGMEKFNPYTKFGVVIGSGAMNYEINDNSDGDIIIMKGKLNGGLAIGYTAAIGANYSLSDKLSLFGEFNLISMSYSPTKGEITESSYNGVSDLAEMTTNDKMTDFVDKVTYDNTPTNDGAPSQELKETYPFSSFGINIGLKYSF